MRLAQILWVVVAVIAVVFSAAYFTSFEPYAVCTAAECEPSELTPDHVAELEDLGLSREVLKGFLGALSGLASLVWVGTGAVLFWRAANDRMALFVSFALVMFGPAVFGVAPDSIRSIADLIATLWSNASFVLLVVLFYTFPNGRFVPRGTLPLVVVWTVVVIAPLPFLLDSNEPRPSWVAELEAIVYLVGFGGPVVAQIYRYRRVYNAVQRQQAKWVVAGIAAVLVGVPGTYAVLESQPVLFLLVGTPVVILSISLIPLSIAVSILRYRLWDIDVLINRVLVYSLLTAALGLTYLAGVVVLQAAFRALTGQESTVALVGSTLAIAALFQPVCVRLQQLIDRRFYRRKYDAARTLEAFAETVRDQVDIDRLSDELVGTVERSLEPAHASLWLAEADGDSIKRGSRISS